MADIEKPIEYSVAMLALMDGKLRDPKFTHVDWGAEDLSEIRAEIRRYYRQVQSGRCAYCRQNISLQSASNCHVEHIAPKSKYRDFIFIPENLCVICADCNEIKKSQETLSEVPDTLLKGATRRRYPRTSGAFFIVHPHFDCFDDHILYLNGFYVDRTKKGHFTIGACNLNRRLRVFGWELPSYSEKELSELMQDFLASSDIESRRRSVSRLRNLLLTDR